MMNIDRLINLDARRQFDSLFVLVADISNNYVFLDKFYLVRKEYESFANSINIYDKENQNWTFSYKYISQKIEVNDFIDLFGFEAQLSDNKLETINHLNNQLKEITIFFDKQENHIVFNDESRRLVNSFFEERKTILEKTSENFPLELENLSNARSLLFRLYNVGQANMSALLVDNEQHPTMIFDLGKSRKCQTAIDLLQNHLPIENSGKCTTVVISHYDDDHINMAKYLPYKGHSLQFIMPEFLHPSDIYKPNIQILLYRAILNGGKVCFILNNSLRRPIIKNYAMFLQGAKNKRDLNQSTDENSHGLVVYLSLFDKNILVPGDVLYDDVFTNLSKPLLPTHAIIPHHACNYNGKPNSKIVDLSYLKESFTFCGPHGRYHHPNFTHFSSYKSKGEHLIRLIRRSGNQNVFCRNIKIPDYYYDTFACAFYDWIIK